MSNSNEQLKKSKKKATVIVLLCVVLIFVTLFGFLCVKANTDNVFSGISVGSADLGGMDKSSAIKVLKDVYSTDDINVRVQCEDILFDIYGSSFSLKLDYEATADKALAYGKDGNVFFKILNMINLKKNPQTINLVISGDYNVLQYAINEKLGEKVQDVQQHSVEIGENELIISNGKEGRLVSAQEVLDLISKAVMQNSLSDIISVNIKTLEPDPIDIEKFINEYNREPKDATVAQNGEEIAITPEVVGVKINKDEARKILDENRNSAYKYSIPAIITHPQITAADLEAEYIDTIIGTYSTDYRDSSTNRKTNIHLASSKINGLTLNPGEVFSFNNVVGPRTQATGYKVAHVYSNNKVVDGIGGGICQVSSTLYNAVVLADLEIVYRTNHSLPVSYVPLGRDATVSYGSIDFKIKNNKETPIKFEILHDGVTLTINVYGRKKYVKDISVETVITGYVPFSTVENEDPDMYEGETRVEEAGVNGTKVEAYKIIKENGVVVSRTLLAKSTYSPTTKIVRVGTKKKNPVSEETTIKSDAITSVSGDVADTLPEDTESSLSDATPSL